jgi:hypothetical protein
MRASSFRRPSRLLLLATGALGFAFASTIAQRHAVAYDSAGADIGTKTPNIPTSTPELGFGTRLFSGSPPAALDVFLASPCPGADGHVTACSSARATSMGVANYNMKVLHGAYGGPDGRDPVAGRLMKCDASAVSPGGAPLDLTRCVPATWSETDAVSDVGWVKVRKQWDVLASGAEAASGHAPEHMIIAQTAAALAGLGTNPLMTERFWIRYPVSDGYVGSPVPSMRGEGEKLVVAQSWIPTGHANLGAHAVRSIYLPELAQMPDVSSSVADWAAGDELCQLSGITDKNGSTFGDPAFDINACHDFTRVMGAVNVTHFLPVSRAVYGHYHALALSRMAGCRDLQDKLAPYYARQGAELAAYAVPLDSEAHVCEREAFVYEMFAQHFLQDAWSTGHMWSRWGGADLSDFPSELGAVPPGGIGIDDFARDEDRPARRFVIAGVVAAFAGMIHGAKGVVESALPGPLATWRNADDPLCGPKIYTPWNVPTPSRNVEWRTSTPNSAPYAGAGDLFWHSSPAATIASDPIYVEQRTRLLACSARSMRDVYRAGGQAHGPMGNAPPVDDSVAAAERVTADDPRVDPLSDYCWDHLVTNESMAAAIGPTYAMWDYGDLSPSQTTAAVQNAMLMNSINAVLIANRATQVGLPFHGNVTLKGTANQTLFLSATSARMNADTLRLNLFLAGNAAQNPGGVESARLASKDGTKLSFLTVPPAVSPPVGATPTAYADVASPRAPSEHPFDRYVSQMFWRAHLEEVCQDNSVVATLRDRCVMAAPGGGDPEACTACVEIAEAHIPSCDRMSSPGLGESKCSALGAGGTGGLPPSWFDSSARFEEPAIKCGYPTRGLAFRYCTGTEEPMLGNDSQGSGATNLTSLETTDSQCGVDVGGGTVLPHHLGRNRLRRGVVDSELNPLYQTPNAMIVAVEGDQFANEWVTKGSGGMETNTCYPVVTTDFDGTAQARLGALPLWNNASHGDPALVWPETMTIGYCGMTQRASLWNRSCDDVAALYGDALSYGASQGNGVYDAASGFESFDTTVAGKPEEKRCSLREARQFVPRCASGMCDSGGVCIGARYVSGAAMTPAGPPVILLQ